MNVEGVSRKRRRSLTPWTRRKKSNVPRVFPSTGISKKNIIGVKQHAVLRYAERFQLDAGVGGTPAVQVYTANGVYDPLVALGGHQPRGLDQLFTIYDHFVVLKCNIKLYFDNNSEASAYIAGVALRDGDATFADFRDYLEWGPKKTVWLAESGAGIAAKTLEWSCSPPAFLGRADPLSDPELKNSDASNPTEQAYWHVFAFPGNTGDASPVNAVVEIEYDGYFIEPKLPPVS